MIRRFATTTLRPILQLLRPALAMVERITDRELGLIAAGVAFFGFLAIFPALASIIALWGFAADPGLIRGQLDMAVDYLPPEAFALLEGQVEALLATNNRQLGWATALSLVLAVWSARAGAAALIRGLNAIHGLPARSGMGHMLRALMLTLTLVGLALAAILAAVVAPLVIAALPLGPGQAMALEAANFGLGLALVILAIGLIYRLGPNRGGMRSPPLFTRGLFLAVVLWAAASRGLVFYLANFGNYNETYGSIGAVVALLLWFYLAAYAILLGGAVDAHVAERRRRAA